MSARTDRFLTFEERVEIQDLTAIGLSAAEIGRRLGRDRSTIWRELNARGRVHVTGAGNVERRPYLATVAQHHRDTKAARPKATKLESSPALAGEVARRLGSRSRPSPQQIAARLRIDFPQDESMRISHETIYQELYVQSRGALKTQVKGALRTGRATRKPRTGAKRPRVRGELLIANRPKDVDGRTVPGHWEGDLILGTANRSAIGTLVERRTRFVILLHLPDGHGADQVADAMAAQIGWLPAHVKRSLTWDQGSEMVGAHERVAAENDITVWFAEPAKPWMRGSNENTNGLLRQYFPKGTDLSTHTAEDLREVADALNERPRETLKWATPAEVMAELLSHPPTNAVATTP